MNTRRLALPSRVLTGVMAVSALAGAFTCGQAFSHQSTILPLSQTQLFVVTAVCGLLAIGSLVGLLAKRPPAEPKSQSRPVQKSAKPRVNKKASIAAEAPSPSVESSRDDLPTITSELATATPEPAISFPNAIEEEFESRFELPAVDYSDDDATMELESSEPRKVTDTVPVIGAIDRTTEIPALTESSSPEPTEATAPQAEPTGDLSTRFPGMFRATGSKESPVAPAPVRRDVAFPAVNRLSPNHELATTAELQSLLNMVSSGHDQQEAMPTAIPDFFLRMPGTSPAPVRQAVAVKQIDSNRPSAPAPSRQPEPSKPAAVVVVDSVTSTSEDLDDLMTLTSIPDDWPS